MAQTESELVNQLLKEKTNRKAEDYAGGVRDWYKSQYNRDLPVAVMGQGGNSHMGWEHSRSFDVSLDPASAEGTALIKYLQSQGIPYIASHGPSKNAQGQITSTGKHIHVGPGSSRLSATQTQETPSTGSALVDKLLREKGVKSKPAPLRPTGQKEEVLKRFNDVLGPLGTVDKTIPTSGDLLKPTPRTQARDTSRVRLKEEVTKEYKARRGGYGQPTATGALHLFANPVDTLTGIFRTDEENINREVEERLKQEETAALPEVTEIRKEYGRMGALKRPVAQSVIGTGGAGLLKFTSGLANLAGYLPKGYVPPLDDLSDWADKRASIIEAGAANAPLDESEKEIVRGLPEKVVKGVADLGVSIGSIMLLKKATNLSFPQLLALEGALKNSRKPIDKQAGATVEGYGLGSALESHLSKAANAALFAVPTAASTGYEVSQGRMSPTDALLQTGIQAGAGALLTPSRKAKPAEPVPDVPRETLLVPPERRLGPARIEGVETPATQYPTTVAGAPRVVGQRTEGELGQGELFTGLLPGMTVGRADLPGKFPPAMTFEEFAQTRGIDLSNPQNLPLKAIDIKLEPLYQAYRDAHARGGGRGEGTVEQRTPGTAVLDYGTFIQGFLAYLRKYDMDPATTPKWVIDALAEKYSQLAYTEADNIRQVAATYSFDPQQMMFPLAGQERSQPVLGSARATPRESSASLGPLAHMEPVDQAYALAELIRARNTKRVWKNLSTDERAKVSRQIDFLQQIVSASDMPSSRPGVVRRSIEDTTRQLEQIEDALASGEALSPRDRKGLTTLATELRAQLERAGKAPEDVAGGVFAKSEGGDTVRFYRADKSDATEPQGGAWTTDPKYASEKYGKGVMGSESMWTIDVPRKALEAEFGDIPSILRKESLDAMGVKVEPQRADPSNPSNSPLGKFLRDEAGEFDPEQLLAGLRKIRDMANERFQSIDYSIPVNDKWDLEASISINKERNSAEIMSVHWAPKRLPNESDEAYSKRYINLGSSIYSQKEKIGPRAALALKSKFLELHPEVKEITFIREGSTGGRRSRTVTLDRSGIKGFIHNEEGSLDVDKIKDWVKNLRVAPRTTPEGGSFNFTKPAKDFSLSDLVSTPLSNLFFKGSYERIGGEKGKAVSDFIRKAQEDTDASNFSWQREIDGIREVLESARAGIPRAKFFSDFIDLIEKPLGDPSRRSSNPKIQEALDKHDALTNAWRDQIITWRRSLGIPTPSNWGITDKGYFRHLFLGDIKIKVDGKFIGEIAHNYHEAQKIALDILAKNPQASVTAEARNLFSGDPTVRLSTSKFWHTVNELTKSTRSTAQQAAGRRVHLTKADILEDVKGTIGQQSSKQKLFGPLFKREGYEGFERNYTNVMDIYASQLSRAQALTELNRNATPVIEEIRKTQPTLARAMENHIEDLWGVPKDYEVWLGNQIKNSPLGAYVPNPDMAMRNIAVRMTGIQAILKLQYNIRSSIVNALDPLSTLWPYTTNAEFAKLYADYAKPSVRKMLRDRGVLQGTTKYLEGGGVEHVRDSFTQRLKNISQAEGVGETTRAIANVVPKPFAAASDMNRGIGYLYGMTDGAKKGLEGEALHRHGLAWARQVEFDNSVWNAPPALRSSAGRVIGQFKGYQLKSLENISTMALRNNVPTEYGGSRVKRGAKYLGAKIAQGGIKTALPGPLRAATAAAVGVTGYELVSALSQQFQDMGSAKETADWLAQAVWYGAPALIGQDLSGSVSILDDLYGRTPYEQAVNLVGGPTAGTFFNLIDPSKSVESKLGGFSPYFKTAGTAKEMLEKGHATVPVGNEHRLDLTPYESIMRILGFTPSRQSAYFDEQRMKAAHKAAPRVWGAAPKKRSTTAAPKIKKPK